MWKRVIISLLNPNPDGRRRAGKLSANAAAIQAGWRKAPSPIERILKLLPKLSPEDRARLVDAVIISMKY
jgi:hypothetical protein